MEERKGYGEEMSKASFLMLDLVYVFAYKRSLSNDFKN